MLIEVSGFIRKIGRGTVRPWRVRLLVRLRNAMGLDFSALIRYGGPSREILPGVTRLERGEEDTPFRQVVAVGLHRGFAFAERADRKAAWRPWSEIEQVIPQRPDLP